MSIEVIVLAAGQGTRMRSSLPKVLHTLGDSPMLMHVLDTANALDPSRIHLITGFQGEQVHQALETTAPRYIEKINWVTQAEQHGTGHAVMQALPHVDKSSRCLILFGDVPLIDSETLRGMCQSSAALTLLTAIPKNNFGLGRIIRDAGNDITGVVEEKDADPHEREIREINTGIMLCKADLLDKWLGQLNNDNSQGEYYLTDIVAMAVADGQPVEGKIAAHPERLTGVNSRANLASTERLYQQLQAQELMESGVTLRDPARFDLRGEATFGRDCTVDINVILEGKVEIGDRVTIEANCVVRNSRIGTGCRIHANSVIEDAELGEGCNVGPFARLRPETRLGSQVRIGNFVEVKKSHLADGAKANHLAYVGDSEVGRNTNIGAGVITCNYDGANKHQTIIGDDVFVGSDTQLVAPVKIASGATIGAGSTITRNIDEGDLAISRAKQTSVKNWKRPVKKKK